jgi:hypothetical protein
MAGVPVSWFWRGRRVLDLSAGLDATVSWHDRVRGGEDARAVTLTQIEDLS